MIARAILDLSLMVLAIVTCNTMAGKAQAAATICLSYPTNMNDAGLFGEDYWTSNQSRRLQYVYVTITRPGYAWSGYLNRNGCTQQDWMGAAADYTVTVHTKSGRIWPSSGGGSGNNRIEVRDAGNGACAGACVDTRTKSYRYAPRRLAAFSNTTIPLANAGASNDGTASAARMRSMLNVLMMTTYALSVDAGGIDNRTFKIQIGDNMLCRLNSMFGVPNGDIELGDLCSSSKFITIHELGHALNWFGTTGGANISGSPPVGSPYRVDEVDDGRSGNLGAVTYSCRSDSSHAMWSVEWGLMAHLEGLAHAYAASIWNDKRGGDCWFGYYKGFDGLTPPMRMSCSAARTTTGTRFDGKDRYMAQGCPNPVDKARKGTEYDWMRAWTSVIFHPTAPLNLGAINAFIRSGTGWNCGSIDPVLPCNSYSIWAKLLTGTLANGVKARLTNPTTGGPFYGVNY